MKKNILIFPGGMENGIEIYNSLKYCKEFNIYSASSNVPNQAFFLYKNNNIVRDIREDGWIDDLNKIVNELKIDLIFPANSLVIDALAKNKKLIQTDILIPDDDILYITRSKKNTINVLKNVIPCPTVYNSIDEIKELPVFVKPDNGYGAQGAEIIDSFDKLKNVDFNKFIVQELLTGKEYTVDCFSDNNSKLLFSNPRERSRIRMGTSMHAEEVSDELKNKLKKYAENILEKIKIKGTWFFQVKEDKNGELKLLEIDVRIAGTMCYNRCRGVNFPLLSIYQFYNNTVSVNTNNIEIVLDRCLKNRYIIKYNYDYVYIDLDDTIIFRDKINTDVIKFLYQCINNNKKIILISKNLEENKTEYLKKYKIYEIFDEVIWLKESDNKADYIKNKNSIFIDDSFSQRLDVAEKIGIPTFDISMLECLIDERI